MVWKREKRDVAERREHDDGRRHETPQAGEAFEAQAGPGRPRGVEQRRRVQRRLEQRPPAEPGQAARATGS
jgi:hypothetical protein